MEYTTFEREGFQKMISDIKNGEVTAVIVKYKSRSGRDHLIISYYMEVFFPNNDVHFVAIYTTMTAKMVITNLLCLKISLKSGIMMFILL